MKYTQDTDIYSIQKPFVSYFNSKSWYTKNPSFKGDNKELNKYELYNVNLLKKLEDSK